MTFALAKLALFMRTQTIPLMPSPGKWVKSDVPGINRNKITFGRVEYSSRKIVSVFHEPSCVCFAIVTTVTTIASEGVRFSRPKYKWSDCSYVAKRPTLGEVQ